MASRRVSIAWVMGVVLVLAVALATLRRPTPSGVHLMYSASAAAPVVAALLAVASQGRERVGWLAFALFSLVYLDAALWRPIRLVPYDGRTALASEYALDMLRPGPADDYRKRLGDFELADASMFQRPFRSGAGEYIFSVIGHSLASLVAGGVGIFLARALAGRGESGPGGTAEAAEGGPA
jgi:hypothetical protein